MKYSFYSFMLSPFDILSRHPKGKIMKETADSIVVSTGEVVPEAQSAQWASGMILYTMVYDKNNLGDMIALKDFLEETAEENSRKLKK